MFLSVFPCSIFYPSYTFPPFLSSLPPYPEFLADFVVVAGDHGQLLFQLALGVAEVHVDGGEVLDAGRGLLVLQLHGAAGAGSLEREGEGINGVVKDENRLLRKNKRMERGKKCLMLRPTYPTCLLSLILT